MAKKEKMTENHVVLTEENIVKELEKKNRMDTALTKEMISEIEKQKEDQKKRLVKERFLKATYQRDLSLLQRRFSKRKNEIALYKIRQSGRLVRLLTGFEFTEQILEYAKTKDDVFNIETLNEKDKTITLVVDIKDNKTETFKLGDEVPAVIDCVDYDSYITKLNDKIKKMTNEAEAEHNTNVAKLEMAYGDYYNCSWRW